MNLDDVAKFHEIDRQDMAGHIGGLPGQLEGAYQQGLGERLPEWSGIRQVVIAGMGGSAIGADLLSAFVLPSCPVPVTVHRDYGLPAFARGPETLVIASSHSGNTEETLSGFEQAQKSGCRILAVATGGKLSELARERNIPLWIFQHKGQPRAAVGFSFGLLLAAFQRLGFAPDSAAAVRQAVADMREQQKTLALDVPVSRNPAKRAAGQAVGRWVTVLASDYLMPVARRWKGQISEIGKAWGQFEFLPEADHNTLAGLSYPEEIQSRMLVLFLRAPSDNPQNRKRSDLTRGAFMTAGFNTDTYDAKGGSPLSHMWTALHFGDYQAYYLAMAYQVDPTPVEAIEGFKQAMKR